MELNDYNAAIMAGPVEPSYLHRLFRIPLGHAPPCVWNGGGDCGPGSGFFAIPAFLLFVVIYMTIAGFRASSHWFHGLWLLPIIVILFRLSDRFESRERFARARIRRGECFGCGEKLGSTERHYCDNCLHTR